MEKGRFVKQESKGRTTYWAAREVGKVQLPVLCFHILTEDLVSELRAAIDKNNEWAAKDGCDGRLELVRVEVTPV